MTARRVPEWIGATPDTRVPDRVRVRVFERYGGRCHWSTRLIAVGDLWDVDHVLALCNGGENRESNLAPILHGAPHREKTALDVKVKKKAARVRKKHLGLQKRSARPMAGSRGHRLKKPLHGNAVERHPKG